MLAYMIAASESTPDPIMVNLTTYARSSQAGFPGAMIVTVAVVLPSFLVILLILRSTEQYVQAVLRGMEPCMIGIYCI